VGGAGLVKTGNSVLRVVVGSSAQRLMYATLHSQTFVLWLKTRRNLHNVVAANWWPQLLIS